MVPISQERVPFLGVTWGNVDDEIGGKERLSELEKLLEAFFLVVAQWI